MLAEVTLLLHALSRLPYVESGSGFFEITFFRLKAGMMAGSSLGAERSSLTARGLNRAVAFFEITFELLLVKIWHKQVLPSPIIKIKKGDCF